MNEAETERSTSSTFYSRVDPLIALVVVGPTLFAFGDVLRRSISAGRLLNVTLVVATLSVVLIAWIYASTRYTVTANELRVQSGPFRWRIALDSIRRIRRTDTIAAAPALSLRRLCIETSNGFRLIVSPNDADDFIGTLKPGLASGARID